MCSALLATLVVSCPVQAFEDRKLGDLPVGDQVIDFQASRYGEMTGYIAGSKGNFWLVLGGARLSKYKVVFQFLLSADGSTAAIMALDKEGSLLAQGDKVVARYTPESRWQFNWPVGLSRDGSTLVYREWKEGVEDSVHRVVVAGKRGPEYRATGIPAVSDDGKVVAYSVWISTDDEDYDAVSINGRLTGKHEMIRWVTITPDGNTVGYVADDGDVSFVIFGHKKIRSPARLWALRISDDGSSWAGVAIRRDKEGLSAAQYIVVNGSIGNGFKDVSLPVFSPSGDHVAYRGQDHQGKSYLVLNDVNHEAKGIKGEPRFSRDGSKVGYGIQLGREVWWKVLEVEKAPRKRR